MINLSLTWPAAASSSLQALPGAVVKTLGVDHCIDVRTHEGTIPRTLNGKIKYFIDASNKSIENSRSIIPGSM